MKIFSFFFSFSITNRTKCSILEYDRLNEKFLIKFTVKEPDDYIKTTEEEIAEENKAREEGEDIDQVRANEPQKMVDKIVTKYVTRLHLRFEMEDEQAFNDRVESAQKRKNAFLALNRYWDFISLQNEELISTVQPSTFENILHRLDSISNIILENQQSVTDLLINVRDDYHLSMKAALLEYARINQTEKERLKDITLPVMRNDTDNIPDYGTIDIDQRHFEFNDTSKYLSSWLFYKYTQLQKTLLEISKDFYQIYAKNCLIKISNYGAAIPVHKFKERQDDHLVAMQDTV